MRETEAIRELRNTIDELCDGSLSEEGVARLNDRLAADAEARAIYLQHMWMEEELYGLSAPLHSDDFDKHDDPALPASSSSDRSDSEKVTLGRRLRASGEFLRSHPWMTLAASMLVVSLLSGLIVYQGTQGQGPLAALDDSQTVSPLEKPLTDDQVARITGTRDCLWDENQDGVGFGSVIRAGQLLRLEQGLAEITFKNGTRIVLEGPSAYLVPGRNDATLLTGQMSAAIPRTATGFTVRTNRLAIGDADTQFGLVAQANGNNEIHVFKGPIHVRAVDARKQEISRVRLSATEAARLSPVESDFSKFSAEGDRFVRTLTPSVGPSEGLLAVEEFDYPVGQLAWHNGGFGWASAWVDLDSAGEPDEPSTNAVGNGSLEVGGELVSQGNRAIQTGQWNRVRRPLSTSLRGVFDAEGLVEDQYGQRLIGRDNKTIYISFLQRVSEVDDVFYGFALYRGDGNANRVLSFGNGAEQTGYGVSSNYNGTYLGDVSVPLFEPLGKEDTEAHLFVVRIDFGEGNRDVVRVYRDPISLLDEEKCALTARLDGDFAFDRISLGNYNGVKGKVHEVDEIRVGTSFTAVTGRRSSAVLEIAEGMNSGGNSRIGVSANKSTGFSLVGSM